MTEAMRSLTAAVMQPYFFPYAGYFRLFAAADIFVIYDCVQFPRRGRVHRCEVTGPSGETEWLTLPLARQPQEVLIRDLAFAENARAELGRRMARLPWIAGADGPMADAVMDYLGHEPETVVDFLEDGLRLINGLLGLDCRMVRSSSLAIPQDIRGQDRIIAIAKAAGASRYVNAPGGRALYDHSTFRAQGLELGFLAPFEGRHRSILPQLLSETPESIRESILAQTQIAPQ